MKHKCLECNKIFKGIKTRKFCSKSCSTSYNNRGVNRHRTNKKYCKNCGKEIPRSNKKYCSFDCQQEYQHSQWIKRWSTGLEDGIIGKYGTSNHIRKYLFRRANNQCESCGWSIKNKFTKKVPLEIHHIDGNWKNNSPENLQLLCPNCHALTKNYKSRGGGRDKR